MNAELDKLIENVAAHTEELNKLKGRIKTLRRWVDEIIACRAVEFSERLLTNIARNVDDSDIANIAYESKRAAIVYVEKRIIEIEQEIESRVKAMIETANIGAASVFGPPIPREPETVLCGTCDGRGKINGYDCPTCANVGFVTRDKQ